MKAPKKPITVSWHTDGKLYWIRVMYWCGCKNARHAWDWKFEFYWTQIGLKLDPPRTAESQFRPELHRNALPIAQALAYDVAMDFIGRQQAKRLAGPK